MQKVLEQLAAGEISLSEAEKALGYPTHEPELGKVVREEAPTEELGVTVAMVGLIGLQMMYSALFSLGVLLGWDQRFLAFLLAMAFLVLGLLMDLYRRSYLPEVLIIKGRRPKSVPKKEVGE